VEIYNYRKDGSGFWNALFVSPVFDEGGRLIYYFASQIDVSARKEAARRQAQRVESMGAPRLRRRARVQQPHDDRGRAAWNARRPGQADERQSAHLGRADWAARRAGNSPRNSCRLRGARRPPTPCWT
jgi:hypothetical protein